MDNLVERLSKGEHPVVFDQRTKDIKEVKERLENGFVFVTFTQTAGGTELGINVDNKLTNINNADFIKGKGTIHLEGTCKLNYHKVQCIADVDLETREGKGFLKILE
jgi:hypothetical protein